MPNKAYKTLVPPLLLTLGALPLGLLLQEPITVKLCAQSNHGYFIFIFLERGQLLTDLDKDFHISTPENTAKCTQYVNDFFSY